MSLQVTVIGDALASDDKYQFCFDMGKLISSLGFVLVTGGRAGVMEAVSKGAYENGGVVVGILPGNTKEQANPYCNVVVPTGLGHTRNSITVMAADIVVVVGGGAGTLSELAFAWIYGKPIIAMEKWGGWGEKLAGEKLDQKRDSEVISCTSLEGLKAILLNYKE